MRPLPPERTEAGWDWPALRERCIREATRVLADSTEAEDVVQEALIRAWRDLPGLRERLVVLLSGGYDKMDLESFARVLRAAS